MNDLETQLRHYAVAVAGPARHDGTEPPEALTPGQGRRVVFAAAAGVLVALAVAAGGFAATRTAPTPSASATAVSNGLRVRLEVNTTAPGPTDEVRAKMTVTNVSGEPVGTETLCPSNVTIERPVTTTPSSVAASAAPSPPVALDEWFNPMRQGVIFHAVGASGTPSDPHCTREDVTLKPGASLSVAVVATPGPFGIDQVPMNIVARPGPPRTIMPATLPFTVPPPPADHVSRSAAIATATARPEVQQWANQVAFGSAIATQGAPGEALIDSRPSGFTVVPDGGGWHITVTYGTHTLDIHINADGTTGSTTADGTTTTF